MFGRPEHFSDLAAPPETFTDARCREGNNLKRFQGFCLKGKALTGFYVPCSLDSGLPEPFSNLAAAPKTLMNGRCLYLPVKAPTGFI